MKNLGILSAVLIASTSLLSLPVVAQDAGFTSVSAELQGKLDTKNAKVGDKVVLRATSGVKLADGTQIPHNAKLTGQVTAIKPHDDSNADAQVAILIDHAEWKGGKSAPIHAVIQTLAPVQDTPADASMSAPSGGGGRMGGGGGGGSMGGGGAARQTTTPTPTPTPNADATVAPSTSAPATPASADGGTGMATTTQADGTVVKTLTARPTGIDGVFVASDPSAPNSGTLFAKGKNLHLGDGTLFTVGVSAPTAK